MVTIIKYIIYPFFVLFITLFILDKLYIFPIDIPLNIKPEGKRSAVYLAKNISRKANCDSGISLFEEVFGLDKPQNFSCTIDNTSFTIFIFYNKQEKQNLLKEIKNNQLHTSCFKEGSYYMICTNPSFGKNRDVNTQSLPNKLLYHYFPGQDVKF